MSKQPVIDVTDYSKSITPEIETAIIDLEVGIDYRPFDHTVGICLGRVSKSKFSSVTIAIYGGQINLEKVADNLVYEVRGFFARNPQTSIEMVTLAPNDNLPLEILLRERAWCN